MSQSRDESAAPPRGSGGAGVWSLLPWLLLVVTVADWYALRTGVLQHPPWVLAALAAAVVLTLMGRFARVAWSLLRGHRGRGAASAQLFLLGGLLVALGAGFTNWALSLQGFVILHEGETVPLHRGSHLQAFEAGPLASLEEMDLVVTLEGVELVATGEEGFYPSSRLRVGRVGEDPVRLEVSPRSGARSGALRFHQGAFGFAPRIVITRGDRTLFDRVVPFTTLRQGPSGVSFDGHFTVEREDLVARGSVSLPEGLDGHASLAVALTHGGNLLGRGTLLPGHFAELPDDHRLGFAGLHKWAEIDVSRRNYRDVVLAGLGLALLGGLTWPLALWRRW